LYFSKFYEEGKQCKAYWPTGEMKLTPWYPGNIKPVREGVYMLMCGFGVEVGYQYWDGSYWGLWCSTPQDAFHFRGKCGAKDQNGMWRGVRK
jgi:hypothetical protein